MRLSPKIVPLAAAIAISAAACSHSSNRSVSSKPTTSVTSQASTTTITTESPTTITTVPPGYWPDATNTGPRIPIPQMKKHDGDYNTTKDGEVISGMEITGRLVIQNANVTVVDSIIRGDSDAGGGHGFFGIQNENNHPGLVVKYTEVGKATTGTLDVGIQIGDGTVDHSDIHSSDGIQASGGATLTNNWIHDLYASYQSGPNQSHIDTIQMFSGPGKTTIQHNWLDCTDHSPTHLLPDAAIFFQGSFDSALIDNNFMTGGGYLLRLESGVKNATVTNNHFKMTDSRGWGNATVQGQIVSQSGNIDDATGKALSGNTGIGHSIGN